MAYTFTPTDLYNIFADTCRYMPAILDGDNRELVCKRINACFPITSEDDMGANTLRKDAFLDNRDWVYSRVWEEGGKQASDLAVGFPRLVYWLNDTVVSGAFRNRLYARNAIYQFALLDQSAQTPCANRLPTCSERNDIEVEGDLQTLLTRFLGMLTRWQRVRIVATGNVVFMPDTQVAAAPAGMYNVLESDLRAYLYKLESIKVQPYSSVTKDNLIAIMGQFEVRFEECLTPPTFDTAQKIERLADRGCCP